jgi:hypothetical protein
LCVYRRTASAIALEQCYPFTAVHVRTWPPRWLVVSHVSDRRIDLVDETGDPRLMVLPGNRSLDGNALLMTAGDFAALVTKMMPWQTAWVLEEASPASQNAGPATAVRAALEHWRTAWEQQDFEAYARCYSASFIPQTDASLASWRTRKREIFAQSSSISVRLSAPSIFVFGPEGPVITTFTQYYRSNLNAAQTFKALRWQREGGHWAINAETALSEVGAPPAGSKRSDE